MAMRGFLHWDYTGWFISALFGGGLALALDRQYGLAYTAFVITGIWALCFWVSCEFLENKRQELERRNVRKNPELLKAKRRRLLQWEWNVAAVIIVATAFFCFWTHGIYEDQRALLLKSQRDDVFDHLSVTPIPFPNTGAILSIPLSIVNNAHPNVEKQTISCTVFGFQTAQSITASDSYLPSPQIFSLGLLGGGRGETVDCKLVIGVPAPMVCVDLLLSITFTVEGQPQSPIEKAYRYTYGQRGNIMDWFQRGMNSPHFCT